MDLILTLFFETIEEKIKARKYFSPTAPLRKNHLINLLEGEGDKVLSLISNSIKIDERIVNFLLGFNEIDLRSGIFLI